MFFLFLLFSMFFLFFRARLRVRFLFFLFLCFCFYLCFFYLCSAGCTTRCRRHGHGCPCHGCAIAFYIFSVIIVFLLPNFREELKEGSLVATVTVKLDSVNVDIIKSAIEIAIDRVSGSVNRSSVPVVRTAVQSHLNDLRAAQVAFDQAIVSGVKP